MRTFPAGSTATAVGVLIHAFTANPPSPSAGQHPPPMLATSVRAPVTGSTFHTRLLLVSAMYTVPDASTATPSGLFSPDAMVEISPVTASTFRTELLTESAMNRFPQTSSTAPYGLYKYAVVAPI